MDLSRLIDNRTPMVVDCTPVDDRFGRDALVVVAKMTWSVSPEGKVGVPIDPQPIRWIPIYNGDTHGASIRYPADDVPEKPGTDIVLVGTAHPSGDGAEPPTQQDVTLRIVRGDELIEKTVRVYGPRTWISSHLSGIVPSAPAALEPTPLIYELSYGGFDDSEPEKPAWEPRNPVGSAVVRDKAKLLGRATPCIEDPDASLTSFKPAPAGFGVVDGHWEPRAQHCGTFDTSWQRERAPIMPEDFDPRFYNVASPDLWSEEPLRGDEAIEVLGVRPEGPWRFKLPHVAPRFESVTRGEREQHETHLDTLLIDADEGRVELSWRVAIVLPKKTEMLETIEIIAEPPLSPELEEQLAMQTGIHELAAKELAEAQA
jgi:hypothetical protein